MIVRALTLFIAFGIPLTVQAGSSDPVLLEELAQAGRSAQNLKAGAAFLAANKQKSGVTVLPSGLQYSVIKAGTGKRPSASDRVVVHYRGTSIGGKEFDSSYSRGQPATFPVNRVIAGWTEALQQMRTGAKWRVAIPPNLAYGQRGAGGAIGPNETLLFDIELLEIK
jgi:FKBP-type peptidyl-prolyl cis-trans isomerase FklB